MCVWHEGVRFSFEQQIFLLSVYLSFSFCFSRQGLDQLENPITMELHWHPNPVSDVVFSHDGKILDLKFTLTKS